MHLLIRYIFNACTNAFVYYYQIKHYIISFYRFLGMLLLFVLMGAFAGFTSARLYKTFKGEKMYIYIYIA